MIFVGTRLGLRANSQLVVAEFKTLFFVFNDNAVQMFDGDRLAVLVCTLNEVINDQITLGIKFHPDRLRIVPQDEGHVFANLG